jgi:hypothetical protein
MFSSWRVIEATAMETYYSNKRVLYHGWTFIHERCRTILLSLAFSDNASWYYSTHDQTAIDQQCLSGHKLAPFRG